jgi:hypothetical protein
MTTVVNKMFHKFDVYIGRGSKWGNPFIIGTDGDREEVIKKYKEYILKNEALKDIEELRDKVLGCYCHPLPCHGDVLIELLEGK